MAWVMAALAAWVSRRALSMTKSWMMPWKRTAVTGDTGGAQLGGVGLALVAQHVGFAGDHERGRQPGELVE